MANPAKAYLATQVKTTSQGELLVMLYEAAIKFLKRARIEIENKDYAKKGIYISKAMAIIHELTESLNKEKGGNITPTLLSLYQFCTSQLVQANIRLDVKRIDDVVRILDGIRSAYAQIVSGEEPTAASAGISAQAHLQAQAQAQAAAMPDPAVQAAPYAAAPEAPQPGRPAQAPRSGLSKPVRYGMTGLNGMAHRPATPQASPAAPATPHPNQPSAPEAQPEPEAAQTAASPAPETSAPEPPAPPAQPQLRTAIRAAKFRAANAYSHNS